MSKAPIPENLRSERDLAVTKSQQFVMQVANKVLEQEGKELVLSVKTATVRGYTIRNEVTGDLSIDKSNVYAARYGQS